VPGEDRVDLGPVRRRQCACALTVPLPMDLGFMEDHSCSCLVSGGLPSDITIMSQICMRSKQMCPEVSNLTHDHGGAHVTRLTWVGDPVCATMLA